MDWHSEKEKSSKRTREDRDHSDRDREHDRDRDRKNRNREGDGKSHRDYDHNHNHRSDRDAKRERYHEPRDHKSRRERSIELRDEREGSRDRDYKRERSYDSRDEREGSRERAYDRKVKRERSYERDEGKDGPKHGKNIIGKAYEERELDIEYRSEREKSVEKRHPIHLHKRKEREESEDSGDREEKRGRVLEEKEKRWRLEDMVEDDKELSGWEKEGKREIRKFEDRVKSEGDKQFDHSQGSGNQKRSSVGNGFSIESSVMALRSVPETSMSPSHPSPTKVSLISTTNENKGVSIRSHEVPGNFSTDGSSTTAGKSGSLSLDALAKAKKALQMQKELSEKLKKIPQEVHEVPSAGPGVLSTTATTAGSAGAAPTMSTLPASTAPVSVRPPASDMTVPPGLARTPNYEAVRRAQELAARMGFRQDPQFAPLINMFPGQVVTEVAVPQKPIKAPVLRLDALGREIDEQGNVVNVAKPSNLSTLKVNINKQKQEAFQILKPELDMDPESNPHFDARMGINKTKLLRPKRMTFQFVEEGKWSKEAESIKLKSKFGEAQAKEQKAKQAQLAKAKAAPDINPNLIEITERVVTKEKLKEPIPEIEWWDVPLLVTGNYGDVPDGGIITEDKIKMEKITIYVEHPRPIEPPAEAPPPPPQPLKLTQKEQKKLRTQRRLAREKDKQEMIRQGLVEPPKPKVKMSNLMKVLGSEATQDPTRLEKEIRSAAAEREQAHIDRNTARKLTPAERREKKERKLFDDPTLEKIVSVYKINDLSHPKTRFKVDMNARENHLTGCAVISDGISVVVVEGGNKSIKRYGKLMLRRIDWATSVKDEDEDGDAEDKPINKCVLVWQGSVAKPSFNRFFIHECTTEATARKVFADAGVPHYWDLAVNFADDQI
ncbi:U4/U6 small nuclear ribonucleoprotein Prp3 [Quillaja saponaria]|uniref:U4/U6 small nuclear ribonucleoprotein Prp3 n=1 Tax=Quillaja saponaria TaxID=32244 RepID=A0AAD7Q865_QUISA|nr:U4/U6 small nuclear ribonucleoprotein Prp3 [Quillaja saponaria]